MKQYHYPLMTSGLLLILLGQQPLWAVEESHSFLEKGAKIDQPEIDRTVLPKINALLAELPDLPTDEAMKGQRGHLFTEGLQPLENREKSPKNLFTESLEQEETIASEDLFIAQIPT